MAELKIFGFKVTAKLKTPKQLKKTAKKNLGLSGQMFNYQPKSFNKKRRY